jgi:hypothetical protein
MTFVAAAIVVGVSLTAGLRSRPQPQVLWAATAVPLAVVAGWFASCIRRYRLKDGDLVVEMPLRSVRFPLAGLVSAVPDRDALRGALRVYGNGGLGAVTGRFRSRRLGPFRAYLTDTGHAVTLRWPNLCVVVSPTQDAWFVEDIRKRSGLSG